MILTKTKAQLCVDLAAARAENTELRVQLARQTAHFDWLSSHVNELKLERAAMLERCLGIQLAGVPVIQRDPTAPALPGVDPAYLPSELKGPPLGDVLAKARDIIGEQRRHGAEGRDTLAAADLQAISFEDMGDDQARALGVSHTPDGAVSYAER
jgi:hypothetical protein